MDHKGVRWLCILALCPWPGLQAENLENSSQTEQVQANQEEFANRTLQESETDRMWVTENRTDPLSRSWGTTTTPAFPFLKSTPEYKINSPAPRQGSSASFWVPPVIAVVLLVGLFLMYRRKRGRESRSRAASINVSSDSDSEDNPALDQAVQLNPPAETVQQICEEAVQTTEALSPATDEEAMGPQA